MIIHCGLLLLFLNCVLTSEYFYDYGLENSATEIDQRYSYWPSVHNAAKLMRLRKRDVQNVPVGQNQNEGGDIIGVKQQALPTQPQLGQAKSKDDKQIVNQEPLNVPVKTNETTPITPLVHNNETATNLTAPAKVLPKQPSLSSPGVIKRGIIVFGGFLLLAFAYFIFYRRKTSKNDNMNTHSMIDANQFRYGVLQSEDKSGNLELSRVPLTMESDDDDDEDLEIFDLEQKKKSLSYVNLQTNDEDLVFHNSTENSRGNDKDNLLLDIESGGGSDTLINWSNNGNKSIL